MADNKTFQTTVATLPSGTVAATKEVSFSGQTTDVQLIEVVAVTGAEGSRTLNEISDAAGLKVQDGGNSLTVDAPVGTPVNVQIGDGTRQATVRDTGTSDSLNVSIVDASGNQITSFGGSGGTSHADDGAFTIGSASSITPMGALADETTTDSVDEGDVGVPRMTLDRKLLTRVVGATDANRLDIDGSGHAQVDIAAASVAVPVTDNSGSLTVDGTVSVSGTVTVDSELPTAAALADNTANPTVPATGAFGMVFDGTTWDRAAGNSTDGALVNLGANNDVTVTGTVTANLAAGTNTNEVVGDVAHDAAAAGNPVLIAASSETMADSAPANRVSADADASRLSVTDGALYVIPTGPQLWAYHENSSSALTDATVHAAPGAGLSLYVQTIVFSTGAATACNVFFEEATTTVLGPYYLEAVAGRGLVINFTSPKKITANTALTVTTSAAIAHGIDVTGFIAPG